MDNTTPKSMWSSRFVLPQHIDLANNTHRESMKRKKPILDEQKFEDFSYAIQESILEGKEVKFFVFRDYGDKEITGKITKFDQYYRRLRIEFEDEDFDWIRLDDITDIILN